MYNFNVITIVVFHFSNKTNKILQLRQTPFIYNIDVTIFFCDILQFNNIINVIFLKDSSQFYSLGGNCCQKFEMMTHCPWPLTFEPKIKLLFVCTAFELPVLTNLSLVE